MMIFKIGILDRSQFQVTNSTDPYREDDELKGY